MNQKIQMLFYSISSVHSNLAVAEIGLNTEPLHGYGECLGGAGVDKGVSQELSSSPSVASILVQTAIDEVPEIGRRRGRRRRGIPVTNCAHQGWPVWLLAGCQKREMPYIALQQTQPQAPYIPRVSVIPSTVGIGVESLGAHVSTGTDISIAGIQCLRQNSANPKVCNFHFLLLVYEQI